MSSDRCPQPETLAAFVDGRSSAAERARVIEHLDACEACREVVAEAAAVADELEAGSEIADQGADRSWWLYAAAPLAATALLVAIFWSGLGVGSGNPAPGELGSAELVATLESGSGVAGLHDSPVAWEEPLWPVHRGGAEAGADPRARAFRLGAQLVALRAALATRDEKRAAAALEGTRDLFAAAGLLDFSDALDAFEDPPSLDDPATELALVALEAEITEASEMQLAYLDFGRWAQASRLAALTGNRTALASEPLAGLPRRWLAGESGWAEVPLEAPARARLEALASLLEGGVGEPELAAIDAQLQAILRSSGVG